MRLSLPPEQGASLPASVAMTAVTDLLFGSPSFFGRRVTRVSSFMRKSQRCLLAVPLEHARNLRCSFSGVGATVAVQGDDRFSDTDASQHCDIYHNGGSRFGRNADSPETRWLSSRDQRACRRRVCAGRESSPVVFPAPSPVLAFPA
jgi:hypothetical protein